MKKIYKISFSKLVGIFMVMISTTSFAQNNPIPPGWEFQATSSNPLGMIIMLEANPRINDILLQPCDPIMQCMGIVDAVTFNGSEKILIPNLRMRSGWRPTLLVGVYDPDHPECGKDEYEHFTAINVYGRGFGDVNRGWMMKKASLSLANKDNPEIVAA